jgi:hypothetical protein
MSTQVKVSQKDRFNEAFGFVNRAAAIFYFKKDTSFTTIISFMNYWKFKRNIDTLIIASTRDLEGKLVKREEVKFENGWVINYTPNIDAEKFEGSVEIEVFALENMRIPFPALMAVYKAHNSISMVHTYARVYSAHEVEENRTITKGEEAGWTIRDSEDVRSLAVIHNGNKLQESQTATLRVLNWRNELKEVKFQLPELKPYTTYKVYPSELYPAIVDFLDGKEGNANLSFQLENSFTRMLVGNETVDGDEFQITHSNFNYSIHLNDVSDTEEAFMNIPKAKFKDLNVIVYPDCTPGSYTVDKGSEQFQFKVGERLSIPVSDDLLTFKSLGGEMPARIVTAMSGKPLNGNCKLPFECSLGVFHKNRPKKSSHWGLVAINRYRSRIILQVLEEVYGKMGDNKITISLYLPFSKDILQKEFVNDEIRELSKGAYVDELFDLRDYDTEEEQFAYIFIRSEPYGGLYLITSLESQLGGLSMEHSF